MSRVYELQRLHAQLRDREHIVMFRARQTSDVLEECLFGWRDQQAHRFGTAIAAPREQALPALGLTFRELGAIIERMAVTAETMEAAIEQVFQRQDEVFKACESAQTGMRSIEYASANVQTKAASADRIAGSVTEGVQSLGTPPV